MNLSRPVSEINDVLLSTGSFHVAVVVYLVGLIEYRVSISVTKEHAMNGDRSGDIIEEGNP